MSANSWVQGRRCNGEYSRGVWPTLGILSKEFQFKLLDRSFRNWVLVSILDSAEFENNSVVAKDGVVVKGRETRGRVNLVHGQDRPMVACQYGACRGAC